MNETIEALLHENKRISDALYSANKRIKNQEKLINEMLYMILKEGN